MNNKILKKIGEGCKLYIPGILLFAWCFSATAYTPPQGQRRLKQAESLETLIKQLQRTSKQFTHKTRSLVIKADKMHKQNQAMETAKNKNGVVSPNTKDLIQRQYTIDRELREFEKLLATMKRNADFVITNLRQNNILPESVEGIIAQANSLQQANQSLRASLPQLKIAGGSGEARYTMKEVKDHFKKPPPLTNGKSYPDGWTNQQKWNKYHEHKERRHTDRQ